ncbi:androgen-induced gene 1 protein-like [Cimex lectularius]|uniref:Uncharacterized protein n=1 Tax=Cimex lectularius TaxID=79782 RepID=A0A8I6TD25_CIMLE|nr:androgen-induced gene 1 protein-like [Cimex lectularius]
MVMNIPVRQRYPMIFPVINGSLHFFGAFYFGCALYMHFVHLRVVVANGLLLFLHGTKFIGIWSAVAQLVYLLYCTGLDLKNIVKPEDSPDASTVVKDFIQTSLVFPSSLVSSVSFWIFFCINKNMIFKNGENRSPLWITHLIYSYNIIIQILEMATSSRNYPNNTASFIGIFSFFVAYVFWTHLVHWYTGEWSYYILEKMNLPVRILFFISFYILLHTGYVLGYLFNSMLWGSDNERKIRPRTEITIVI